MLITPKKCAVCGEEFWPNSYNQRYCGDICAERKKRIDREESRKRKLVQKVCVGCGNIFVATDNRKMYCTTECIARTRAATMRSARADKKTGWAYEKAQAALEPKDRMLQMRTCHDCGKPTWNYRCDACLRKWRKKNGVAVEIVGDNDDGW